METLITILAIAALAAILVGQVIWMVNTYRESQEKQRKLRGSVSIETVCDECGHTMSRDGAYIFRKRYLCGRCLEKAISKLKEEDTDGRQQ